MKINDQRGFALPAAIGALVIIGVLVTAGFYTSQQELRIGVASRYANMAVNIAQAGANEVLGNWNGYELGNIPTWSDTTITDTIASGIWEVSIANTNNFVYYLTSTGTVTEGGARWAGASRTIGVVTKMIFADINPPAALTTRGATVVKGASVVNGTNYTPTSWSGWCTGFSTGDKPGIMAPEADSVGTVGGGTITGTPPVAEDSDIVDSTFTNFGDMDWAELTALALAEGKNLSTLGSNVTAGIGPDTTATGRCNETPLTNWGDTLPSAPCGAYFPLMYHDGGALDVMQIRGGGFGQGILLVDGDLEIGGGFTFMGVIVIQGELSTTGNNNTIIGAVMASNANVDNQLIGGTALVQSSQCAVRRAILNNASLSRARPLVERSWVDLTAVAN